MTPTPTIETLQKENDALKQRVAALEAEQTHAQHVLDKLPQLLYVYDMVEQRNVSTNRELADMLGYSPDEIQAMGENVLAQVIHPDDLADVIPPHFARLAAAGDDEPVDVTYRLRTRSDEWRWVQSRDVAFARKDDGSLWQILGMVQDITERKALEDELRTFKTMFENTPDLVGVATLQGVVTYANPAFQQVLGYGSETIGMRIETFTAPEAQEPLGEAFQTVMAQGTWQGELTYQCADDTTFPAVVSSFLVYDKQDKPYAVAAIIRDITERKQLEEDLREREERLRYILEGSRNGAWDTNLVTGETYYSPRYAEILGHPPEELAPTVDTWLNNIHPDDVADANSLFQAYLEGRVDEYVCEHRLRHASGKWLWVIARGVITSRDEHGKPVRMAGTVTDITERKHMENNLRLFNSLVDNAADGIAVASLEGVVTYANAAYRRMVHYGDEIVGTSVLDLYGEPPERLQELFQLVIEEGVWDGELAYRRKDGSTGPVLLSAFAVYNEQGTVQAVSGILRDLTEQKQQEEEQAALQERVIEAQRAALRELSSPLIPIADNVVIMPLIGSIDSGRAQLVMETLLEGVATHSADVAIIDITGVQVVDTQVANALIQAAQAVKLLGAQVILTGIGPTMAQTLVSLGADLSSIVTRGNLQNGIAYALDNKQ